MIVREKWLNNVRNHTKRDADLEDRKWQLQDTPMLQAGKNYTLKVCGRKELSGLT